MRFVGSNPTLSANIESLAQLAEQRAFNPQVQGSTPWGFTNLGLVDKLVKQPYNRIQDKPECGH